jgi:glycosyltransferase involved in cell wall biosynthesis
MNIGSGRGSDFPLVSVVIPFFNREHCLGKAIESVLNQSFDNWEIVLVDDGSTDGSLRIAQRYCAKYPERIRVLIQHNKGPSAARNRAIRESRGELIGILDSDDQWRPGFLETTTAAVQQCPAVDWVYVNACRLDAAGNVIVPSVFDDESAKDFRRLRTELHGNLHLIVDEDLLLTAIKSTIKVGANSLVRRRVFDTCMYPEGIALGDDRVLSIACIAGGFRFGYVDEVLLNVYQYGDNMSARENSDQQLLATNRQLIRTYERIRSDVPLEPRAMRALRTKLSGLYYDAAVHCLELRESYLRAVALLLQSILLSPFDHPIYRFIGKRMRFWS